MSGGAVVVVGASMPTWSWRRRGLDMFNGALGARLAAGEDVLAATRVAVAVASPAVAATGARGGMPARTAIEAALRA